jgi:hypothetical protein
MPLLILAVITLILLWPLIARIALQTTSSGRVGVEGGPCSTSPR